MSEDKPKPGARPAHRVTTTTIAETELGALEERVLRARRGAPIPDDLPLAQKDDGLPPEVTARLRALEERAFRKTGRLEELRADLERAETAEAERDARRRKIVAHLRGPTHGDGPGSDPVD